jgi:hypothetical protein
VYKFLLFEGCYVPIISEFFLYLHSFYCVPYISSPKFISQANENQNLFFFYKQCRIVVSARKLSKYIFFDFYQRTVQLPAALRQAKCGREGFKSFHPQKNIKRMAIFFYLSVVIFILWGQFFMCGENLNITMHLASICTCRGVFGISLLAYFC